MSDSSDDEPLIKIAENTAKVGKKLNFVPPKISVDTKREESTSGDSSDDKPLSELANTANSDPARKLHIMPSKTATPPMRPRKERRTKMNMVKYEETSSDSSDDEPLVEIKQKLTKTGKAQRVAANRQMTKPKEESLKAKKSLAEINSSSTSTGTSDKKAGVNMSDSSDDEPLIKIAKNTAKVGKKLNFVPPKSSVDTKREESTSGDSSDDKPLSELANTANSDSERKLHIRPSKTATPPMRPRKERRTKMNMVKYEETSSDNSDDEPLVEIKQKLTKTGKAQRVTANRQMTKPKEESLKAKKSLAEINSSSTSTGTSDKKAGVNMSDSSDDEPLIKIAENMAKVGKKLNFVPPKISVDTKREESTSGDSSDDKPLSELANTANLGPERKLHIMPSKTATPPMRSRKERSTKMNMVKYEETSSDNSDDEPLVEIKQKLTKTGKAQRVAANRQMTKPKEKSLKAKKSLAEINSSSTSTGTSDKKAGVNMSDSSDDEPLIKIAKNTAKVGKKLNFVPPKSSVDTKREESTSGDSSDDKPLSELANKANSDSERKLHIMPSKTATPPMRPRKERSTKMNMVKYEETSSDSSDDEPLVEIKQKLTKTGKAQRVTAKRQMTKPKEESLKAKKSLAEINSSSTSTGTSDKKAGVNMSDSSDDEPLIKIAKNTAKVGKKLNFVPPKSSVDTKREESTSGDSSDDKPLSELANKANSDSERKLHIMPSKTATPPMRPRKERRTKMNMVKYEETSSDSSDDEPLVEIKQKLTKTGKAQRVAANRQMTKPKEESLKEPTSGDSSDDEPLSELAKKITSEPQRKLHIMPSKTVIPAMRSRKEKAAEKVMDEETYSDSSDDNPLVKIKLKMTTTDNVQKANLSTQKEECDGRKTTLHVNTAKKKQGSDCDSSEDEPLIDLFKRKSTGTGINTAKRKNTHMSGSSGKRSCYKPFNKAVHHPQVTKMVKIILERCAWDCDENETSTG